MLLFPNDGCLCRLCAMVSQRDGCWLTLVRLHQLSRDSSGGGSFAIGSGAYLWLPLFSFALLSGCGVLFVIFFFPLDPSAPPPPSMCTHTSLCYLLWRFSSVSPGQKGSPLLALYAVELLMVFLMAADGRRQPLALGLGAQRSFNKSKSSPAPLHQYFWSITMKVRWRSLVQKPVLCERRRNIW